LVRAVPLVPSDFGLTFVKMHHPNDEVIARDVGPPVCKAAFEQALFVYPDARLEIQARGKDLF